jgi:hypothetical protein
LWQRVHASVALGGFFVWATDEQTRTAHAAQLSRWMSQYAEIGEVPAAASGTAKPSASRAPAGLGGAGPAAAAPAAAPIAAPAAVLPEAARDATYRLQVPAGAAAALWAQREVPQQDGTAAG